MGSGIKILFINYEYPPVGGGGANANARIFSHFADMKDLDITLITSAAPGEDYSESFLFPNIRAIRLPVGKRDLHYWRESEVLRFIIRAEITARSELKGGRFDLCHAFFGFPSGLISYHLRKRMPYIVSLRGSDVPGFNERFSAQYVFLKPVFRKIWQNADCVVCNSRGLVNLAEKTDRSIPYRIIPNGVDTDEFYPAESPAWPPRIINVSRLIRRKGHRELLEAFYGVREHFPDAVLDLVGEGDLETRLKNDCVKLGIQEHVNFRGYVRHEDVAALYRDSSIFILPSFNEGMSNSALEAMASGLPLLLSDTGGTAELLDDNGLLVQPGNARSIEQALINALSDRQKLQKMGIRSRELAMNRSWKTVAVQTVELYEDILRHKRI